MIRDPGPLLKLEDFPTRIKSRPCLTCTLPGDLRKLLEDDRKGAEPHSYDQLSRFLKTRGVDIGMSAVQAHFRKGHAK